MPRAILILFLICVYRCVGLDSGTLKIMSELSWNTRRFFMNYTFQQEKKSNAESLLRDHHIRIRRQAVENPSPAESNATEPPGDDDIMKTKLFRLMYETVKDTDLKIKKAELVKANYENATGFDLGYVIGDMTDKLNSMQDVAKTLKRLYDEWKPVEHVNAYEQIANLAIEVTHLADMIRVITATTGAGKI